MSQLDIIDLLYQFCPNWFNYYTKWWQWWRQKWTDCMRKYEFSLILHIFSKYNLFWSMPQVPPTVHRHSSYIFLLQFDLDLSFAQVSCPNSTCFTNLISTFVRVSQWIMKNVNESVMEWRVKGSMWASVHVPVVAVKAYLQFRGFRIIW